jgi:MFS family permease
MAFFGQWSGNGPVSYYYPTMLQGAGINNNHTRLLYNGMQNVVSFAGAIFGAVYTDSWGRRPQLLVSTALLVGVFTIVCALVATNLQTGPDGKYIYDVKTGTPLIKRPGQARAVIAFVFICGFIYSTGYTPLQQLYPVECLRYESRAKGMAFYNFWVNIANFYNTFVTGIAFSKAGWKVCCLLFLSLPVYLSQHRLTQSALLVLLLIHILGHVRIRYYLLLLRRNSAPHPRGDQRHLQRKETRPTFFEQNTHHRARERERSNRDVG